jgi:hypothetical protein
MDKYYIVTLSIGDWDGISYNQLFITDKEYKAKWYCSKGNGILKRSAEYYASLLEELHDDCDDIHSRSSDYSHISNMRDLSNGTFTYSEIKFRSDIKF